MSDALTESPTQPQHVTSCPGRFMPDRSMLPISKQNKPLSMATSMSEKFQSSSRLKLAIGLCCFVFLTHTMLTLMVGREMGSDRDIKNTNDHLHLIKSRPKRAVSQDDSPLDLPQRVSHVKQDTSIEDTDQTFIKQNKEQLSLSFDKCRNGHIQGLGPYCDANGCLSKMLKETINGQMSNQDTYLNPNSANFTAFGASQADGGKDVLLLAVLSRVQWDMGIFGSVGLIENQRTTFSENFLLTASTQLGERIFKTKCAAEGSRSKSSELNNVDVNLHHGFSTRTIDISGSIDNQVMMFQGDLRELSKQFFIDVAIPQFRMIGIGGSRDVLDMISSLERATCLLRDGGLLVVQGILGDSSASTLALKQFFTKHGPGALAPCFKVQDRMFLCTTNWKNRLIKAITQDQSITRKFVLKREQLEILDRKFTYLSLLK